MSWKKGKWSMKRPTKDECLRWLIQAQDEWADADELRKRNRHYLALFHFQQAAEKALKAYLYMQSHSVEVFRTHSVDELGRMAAELDDDFRNVARSKKLDQYYIPTRYPNGLPGGVPSRYYDDPEESERAMRLAKMVLDLAAEKLGQ